LFDIKNLLLSFAVDVLGLAAFGVDFQALQGGTKQNEYYKSYERLLAYSTNASSSFFPITIRERFPFPSVNRARADAEVMKKMTHKIAEGRKDNTEKKNI